MEENEDTVRAAHETVQQHFSDLRESAIDPETLAAELLARGMISTTAEWNSRQASVNPANRRADLVNQVMKQIGSKRPGAFENFLQALSKEPQNKHICAKLMKTYETKSETYSKAKKLSAETEGPLQQQHHHHHHQQQQQQESAATSNPIGRLGDTPTILDLSTMKGADGKPLKIIQVISAEDYVTFGTCLLKDKNGSTVDLIRKDHLQYGASRGDITRAILQHWLASTVAPRTYQHLIDCLNATDKLDGLAELIQEALTNETKSETYLQAKQLSAEPEGPLQQQQQQESATTSKPIGRLGEAVQIAELKCFKYEDASGKTKRLFVIAEMAHQWKDVGAALNFTPAELQIIAMAKHHVPEDCCTDLMTKWMSGFVSQRDQRPRTWATLLEAMEDSRLGDLAETLEALLKQ